MMEVPFIDLKAQYETIRNEIDDAIRQVIESCAFAGGPFVKKFEEGFAGFCGSMNAIGVGSGTEAIWLSLLAFGIGSGDEVITVPNTFIATVEAITYCGATPVLVDIDEKTYNMNVSGLEKAITKNTKAVIPVHLFGQTADMDRIMEIAGKYGLIVIEDACQAHGAEYRGKKAGTIGDVGCFSFYPGKNLGAYGEAGALVTNNNVIAESIRMIRDHGQEKKYHHHMMGWNSRMDGIQGAILNVKLRHLSNWNEARRKAANFYNSQMKDLEDIVIPFESEYNKHVYHLYAIRAKSRNDLALALGEKNIQTGIHYPIPVHRQKAYDGYPQYNREFPVAEKCAEEFLSLPLYPEISSQQMTYVTDAIKDFLEANQKAYQTKRTGSL